MFKGLKKVLKVYPLPIFVILLTFVIYYFAFEAVNKNTHKTDAITEEESMLSNENQVLAQSAPQEMQVLPQETITQESQEPQGQELAQNEVEPLPEPQTILLITSRVKSLNIRQSPQTTAQVVGKLTPAQNAIVLEEQNGWLRIASALDSSELGWILKEYSKEIKQEIVQIPQEPQKAESSESQITQTLESTQTKEIKTLVTSRVKSLNIRQSPQTTAQVVGKLTPAQNAIVLEEQNGWLRIASALDSSELGWILKEYSKEIKQEIIQDSTQSTQETQKAESIESQTTQAQETPQSAESLASNSKEFSENNANTTQTLIESKQIFTTKVRVNIREIPSTEGKIIGKLTPEDAIIILEEKDGWAKITSDNGDKSGFVVRRALVLKEN